MGMGMGGAGYGGRGGGEFEGPGAYGAGPAAMGTSTLPHTLAHSPHDGQPLVDEPMVEAGVPLCYLHPSALPLVHIALQSS